MNEIIKHEPAVAPVILEPDGQISSEELSVKVALAAVQMSRLPSGQIDVEALREIRGMAKELRDEEKIQKFARAMSAAQKEMQPVIRAAEVRLSKAGSAEDKGSYKFASLEDIDEKLRPIYTKYGFSVTFDRVPRPQDGGGYVVTGTLWHDGGHFITASFSLGLDSGPGRSNAQAAGSTDSYGRKYILLGFFNIVRKNEDKDGSVDDDALVTHEEAMQILKLVGEADVADGETSIDGRRAKIGRWLDDLLGYPLPKGYASIKLEDGIRVRRVLTSLKASKQAAKAKETQI
jgi:ERF superfamily